MSRARLERLHALRGSFGSEVARERGRLVAALARARWRDAESLAAWHDELLYLAAFPDSLANRRAAHRALAAIAPAVRRLPARERELLADSGIAGTVTSHTFNLGASRWLARQHEDLAFAWPDPDEATRLDPFIRLALTPAEGDLFDSGEVATPEWMDAAAARTPAGRRGTRTAAHWLLAHALDAPEQVQRALYDAAEAPLRWELGASRWSATRARLDGRPVLREGFRAPPQDIPAHVVTRLRGIRLAGPAEARRWHDLACAALLARTREVFPTVYADLREVIVAPLGEGVRLVLFATGAADRSALEANYGYLIASNGVPIGYGGVTTFGAQANTGINIFEAFRRSEAPFVFAQALRAFRTLFGVTRFVVNPYQFGAGNDEAIASGAYWFYDRLGFRPDEPKVAALAAREREAMRRDRTHRSSARTLRALAGGDLVLTLHDATGTGPMPESLLEDAGRLATRALASVAAGERSAWLARQARVLRRRCTGRAGPLTAAERRGAPHLVPVFHALAPRIARWPLEQREALWALVALKGAARERGFGRAAARHARLWSALAAESSRGR